METSLENLLKFNIKKNDLKKITLIDNETKEELTTLDEDTTKLIKQYAEENYLTIEEAVDEVLRKVLRLQRKTVAKNLIEHPVETIKNIYRTKKSLKEERK